MSDLRRSISDLRNLSDGLDACIESLERLAEPVTPGVIWDRDLRDELARNDNCPGVLANGWWTRRLDQIDGLTFHHTLSNSPHAFARYYITKAGGRPSVPYSIWITETGQVIQCNDLEVGCWHDHTGHRNTHLSVGLAGRLHEYKPADVQLDAAARVAVWAICYPEMRISLETVKGHQDHYPGTECPGWASKKSGFWKQELYNRIEELLK